MLDKLKALFIVEENDAFDKDKKEINRIKSEEKNIADSDDKGAINDKIMTELLTVLNDNNQDGFDYIEFKNAIEQLKSMKMDEKTRYISAFTTAKTLGVTAPKLVNSISIYLKVLQKEQQKFNESLSSNSSNLNLSQKREYSDLIADKKQQINKLTQEIIDLEKKIYGVSSKDYSKYEFESTFNVLVQQMRDDIKKINQYL